MSVTALTDKRTQARLRDLADGLAAATVVSLPWSTSATSILVVLWLIALIPTLRWADLRETLSHPAAYLPVALFALAVLGTLWAADVPWQERSRAVSGFSKLLLLPLFFAQFRRSANAHWILYGFIASCTVLLALSTLSGLFPATALFSWVKQPGVPVKDYIIQAALFVVAGFVLLYLALEKLRARDYRAAVGSAALACAFLVNIAFVVTSRTALVTIPVLLLLFALRCFGWKGICGVAAAGVMLSAALWFSSDNVRLRLGNLSSEIETYRMSNAQTSAGERLEFWTKSVGFVAEAPVIGHGTGSIRSQFARVASGAGVSALVSTNPHNQFLSVSVQLGLVGGALLIAMWIAHVLLFLQPGFAAWIGLVVVTQNVIGSLFNSHLSDFSNGWLYVFGVGIAGGAAMAQRTTRTHR